MDIAVFIPIVLFVCIYLSIKAVVDARARRHLVQSHGSEDMLRTLLAGEESRRRHASLRWGVILVALAVGFGVLEAVGGEDPSPLMFAILLGATGLGNLAAYAVTRHLK
ncbi:hypothetical protein [Luteimonas sp. SDU82]|uniref:hypothetical protein n=1 Tax=Luteimonas sp. SDU82 TaxID=3422592 RepID=UPI003EC1013E